jgi:hypothetical protein
MVLGMDALMGVDFVQPLTWRSVRRCCTGWYSGLACVLGKQQHAQRSAEQMAMYLEYFMHFNTPM